MVMKMYCYCITDGSRTYIGATKYIQRRIRQHNREITGGARSTRRSAGKWNYFIVCTGFSSWKDCLSFEWHWKHVSRYRRGENPHSRRMRDLKCLQRQDRWAEIVAIHFPSSDSLCHIHRLDSK